MGAELEVTRGFDADTVGRELLLRHLEAAAPWALSLLGDDADAILRSALRSAAPLERARAPLDVAPQIARLRLDAAASRVLTAFLVAARSHPVARWLGAAGEAGVTRRGETVLSRRLLVGALTADDLGAPRLRDAIARLEAAGLLAPAVSPESCVLPLAVAAFLDDTTDGASSGTRPALRLLAPGCALHQAGVDSRIVDGAHALLPAVFSRGARCLVGRSMAESDLAFLAGALAGPDGQYLSLTVADSDEATVRAAFALAHATGVWLLVLAGAPALASQLLVDLLHAGARWLLNGPDEGRLPPSLQWATEVTAAEVAEALAVAVTRGPPDAARLALFAASERRGPGALRVAITALCHPRMLDAVEAAARRQLSDSSGLRPLVHMPPNDLLTDEARAQFAGVLGALDARAAMSTGHYAQLMHQSLVVQLTGSDEGLERAALGWLAERTGMEVLRMEAASVVSRWVGEGEQNLRRQFLAARELGAMVYLPAADSLLHRRTAVSTNADRHSNRQVNYLLQLLETHPGVLLFSTDRPQDLDSALARRVLYRVELPPLDAHARRHLLEALLPGELRRTIDLKKLATQALPVDAVCRLVVDALVAASAEGTPLAQRHLEAALAANRDRST